MDPYDDAGRRGYDAAGAQRIIQDDMPVHGTGHIDVHKTIGKHDSAAENGRRRSGDCAAGAENYRDGRNAMADSGDIRIACPGGARNG